MLHTFRPGEPLKKELTNAVNRLIKLKQGINNAYTFSRFFSR